MNYINLVRKPKIKLMMIITLLMLSVFYLPKSFSDTTVSIKATILSSPCKFSDSNPINVDFYTVKKNEIEKIRKTIPYQVTCETINGKDMKFKIQGESASFDKKILATDQDSLGIVIYAGDEIMPLNTWSSFTYPGTPQLSAKLKQEEGKTTLGHFSSSALMLIEYE